MVRCDKPSTRNMAQSSRWLAANARAANATATALNKAASSAIRLRNFSARSSVWLISGRPPCSDSTRTPRAAAALPAAAEPGFTWASAQATKAFTAASSPATAVR